MNANRYETKNQENLIIPISGPAFAVLKEAMKLKHLKSPYAFCHDDGTPYYKDKVQRGLMRALKLAGIDLDTLADLMGHKDTRMTRRYAHITPVHLQSAVELLEKSHSAFSTM